MTSPARGPANAPVTIIEFSDFQCKSCAYVSPTLEQVVAKYGRKVRLVFRQFPRPEDQNAVKAAEASLCANEQGKFWEMHDLLFKDQQSTGVTALESKAAAIAGIDLDRFSNCLESGRQRAAVQTDINFGNIAGVNGTPTFIINGHAVSGPVPADAISDLIAKELRKRDHS
jgi:protein-disulfide isomerase